MKLIAASAFCALMVVAGSSQSVLASCAHGSFRPSEMDHAEHMKSALARVHSLNDFSQGAYHGTAFVVDAGHGLLLTAYHVAKDATQRDDPSNRLVSLYFPGLSPSIETTAKVVRYVRRPSQIALEDKEDHVHDLALLQVEDEAVRQRLEDVRLALGRVESSDKATAYSYYRASSTPVPSSGTVSLPTKTTDSRIAVKCRFDLTSMTAGGDSGGPVVLPDGSVVGVVLSDVPHGSTKTAKYLQSECIRDTLVDWYLDFAEARIAEVAQMIIEKQPGELTQLLRPHPFGSDSVSNLEFSAALHQLPVVLRNSPGMTEANHENLKSKVQCPIMMAAIERKVGLLPLESLNALMARALAQGDARAIADQFLRFAKSHVGANDYLTAAYAEASSKLYLREWFSQAVSVFPFREGTNLKLAQATSLAQTLKGYGDSQLLLGDLRADYQPDVAAIHFERSKQYSILASAVAPQAQFALRGQALATAGSASTRLGDYDLAIEAFSLARANGIEDEWVLNSYNHAFRLRDNVLMLENARNYSPIDTFTARSLPEAVKSYGSHLERRGISGWEQLRPGKIERFISPFQ